MLCVPSSSAFPVTLSHRAPTLSSRSSVALLHHPSQPCSPIVLLSCAAPSRSSIMLPYHTLSITNLHHTAPSRSLVMHLYRAPPLCFSVMLVRHAPLSRLL